MSRKSGDRFSDKDMHNIKKARTHPDKGCALGQPEEARCRIAAGIRRRLVRAAEIETATWSDWSRQSAGLTSIFSIAIAASAIISSKRYGNAFCRRRISPPALRRKIWRGGWLSGNGRRFCIFRRGTRALNLKTFHALLRG